MPTRPPEFYLVYKFRKGNVAQFDRIELLLSFTPGKDSIGAILRTFIDAIKIHDNIIKKIEECQQSVDSLKKTFIKKSRLLENLNNSLNILIPNASEYELFKKIDLIMITYETDLHAARILKNKVFSVF